MVDDRLPTLGLGGLAILAMSLSACIVVDDKGHHDGNGGSAVSERDMAAHCRGEAAQKYDVRPQDITTLPVERSGTAYIVYGEYADGSKTRTFQCKFDGDGRFQSVSRD